MANFSLTMDRDYDQHIVLYTIYPKIKEDNKHSFNVKKFQNEIIDFIAPFLKLHIWQKDKFELIPVDFDDVRLSYLKGTVNYEYNVEDEWFIVFLLFEISKKFDVIIRITDMDGEFLLIEAAPFLKKWMSSEKSVGRVFIVNGIVHFIPPDSPLDFKINPMEVINSIKMNPELLEPDISITNAILKRIDGYPEKIEADKHRTRVYIPVKLAALLDKHPELIAMSINALYSEDAEEKNVFHIVKYFKREDCVVRLVTFTKCLYAMLVSKEIEMPNVPTNGWYMTKEFENIEKEYKLGYKIAMGFELLVSSEENESNAYRTELLKKYIKRLEEKDYFKNNLPGSNEYTRLRENAENYFYTNTNPQVDNPESVTSILKTLNYDLEHYKNTEANLPQSDNDVWLTVSETDLAAMLEKQYSIKTTNNPYSVCSALSSYLTSKNDEFPDEIEESDDDTVDNDDDDSDNDIDHIEDGIVFREDGFFDFINQHLGELDDKEIELLNKETIFEEFDCGKDISGDTNPGSELDDKVVEPTKKLRNEDKFQLYLDMMDRELASTTLAESFVTSKKCSNKTENEVVTNDEMDSVSQIDVEENAIKNLAISFGEQAGGPGPAGNLLNAVGLRIEK